MLVGPNTVPAKSSPTISAMSGNCNRASRGGLRQAWVMHVGRLGWRGRCRALAVVAARAAQGSTSACCTWSCQITHLCQGSPELGHRWGDLERCEHGGLLRLRLGASHRQAHQQQHRHDLSVHHARNYAAAQHAGVSGRGLGAGTRGATTNHSAMFHACGPNPAGGVLRKRNRRGTALQMHWGWPRRQSGAHCRPAARDRQRQVGPPPGCSPAASPSNGGEVMQRWQAGKQVQLLQVGSPTATACCAVLCRRCTASWHLGPRTGPSACGVHQEGLWRHSCFHLLAPAASPPTRRRAASPSLTSPAAPAGNCVGGRACVL